MNKEERKKTLQILFLMLSERLEEITNISGEKGLDENGDFKETITIEMIHKVGIEDRELWNTLK